MPIESSLVLPATISNDRYKNRFRDALLALIHDGVNKLGDKLVAEFWVRQNLSFSYFTFSWHVTSVSSLRISNDLAASLGRQSSLGFRGLCDNELQVNL